jgi:hypothetical protein
MFPLLISHEVYIFMLTFFENYSNLNFSEYVTTEHRRQRAGGRRKEV